MLITVNVPTYKAKIATLNVLNNCILTHVTLKPKFSVILVLFQAIFKQLFSVNKDKYAPQWGIQYDSYQFSQ